MLIIVIACNHAPAKLLANWEVQTKVLVDIVLKTVSCESTDGLMLHKGHRAAHASS